MSRAHAGLPRRVLLALAALVVLATTPAEAVRRRRVEVTPDDLFVERLLGLQLTQQSVQRGKTFAAGVVDRVGEAGLTELMTKPDALPTPAEIDAPGLWIARLEL